MSEPETTRFEEMERLLFGVRPRLHRFCARMLGSAIDGEDVAQEAVVKALEALPHQAQIRNLEAWLFRIARNAALDFLRRRSRERLIEVEDDADFADPFMDTERGLQAAASLRQFMWLPPAQRAAVILADVLGYSGEEVSEILETTLASVKALLHRGRERLLQLSAQPGTAPLPVLPESERARLVSYVDRFNARDFDSLRTLLADDVRLDVNGIRLHGRDVREYFNRYAAIYDVRLVAGIAEGQAVAFAYDGEVLAYFIVFGWEDGQIVKILDFRYAHYVLDALRINLLTGQAVPGTLH